MRLIREVSTGERGAPDGNDNRSDDKVTNDDNMTVCNDDDGNDSERATGTSLDYTLERLHRDAPEERPPDLPNDL